jgi:glutaminyl-tRNA synthetase
VPFGRELLVERDDFAAEPPAGWKRLAPGREVRLAGAYIVKVDAFTRGPGGEVTAIHCTHDPHSLAGEGARRRAEGTIHWVHAGRSAPAEVRLYDRLFAVEQPDAEEDFRTALNSDSLVVARDARVEPAVADAEPGSRWQFLRQGWFVVDPVDSRPGAPVFNRTITLKDTWARAAEAKDGKPAKAAARPAAETIPVAPRRSRGDARAALHAANPEAAARFARLRGLGLGEAEADLLAGDAVAAVYFDAALESGAKPESAARWLLNDLVGLAKERGLNGIPLRGDAFGRFVALVDGGRLTTSGGKALLADLAASGGEPAERMAALGLAKVEDRGAVAAAVDRALAANAAEAARYRAGEKKLLGVLLGAAMKETQGAAEAAVLREVLLQRLG